MLVIDVDVSDWVQLIRAEYLESPGLSLTEPQVQRLWGLDPDICRQALDEMTDTKFLRRTALGTYVRTDIGR